MKLKKPEWIKTRFPVDLSRVKYIKTIMRSNYLHSVCEEALCPNLNECFNNGTATFMILGTTCTRHCPFCDVKHGRPRAPDINEPLRLAKVISDMNLKYVVITSVNRDDLHDGGAQHFAKCISVIRKNNPNIKIEILVPDFRGCMNYAISILSSCPPDIFNHNLENVPRLYYKVRPGADYNRSLKLLESFKKMNPKIPTKSGLMVGLGETDSEIIEVMHDLRKHRVDMLTIGQYLQPSSKHLPVQRYLSPDKFYAMKKKAISIGFNYAVCGTFIRSSYHANKQAENKEIN